MKVPALFFCLLLTPAAFAAKPDAPGKKPEAPKAEAPKETKPEKPKDQAADKPGLEPGKKAPPAERDFNPDAEHCADTRHCDRRCYAGPSNCEGRHCSRDFVCREGSYDPWHGGKPEPDVVKKIRDEYYAEKPLPVTYAGKKERAAAEQRRSRSRLPRPDQCRGAAPGNCPPGCYSGPSTCVGMACRQDAICAAPGYNPYRGR